MSFWYFCHTWQSSFSANWLVSKQVFCTSRTSQDFTGSCHFVAFCSCAVSFHLWHSFLLSWRLRVFPLCAAAPILSNLVGFKVKASSQSTVTCRPQNACMIYSKTKTLLCKDLQISKTLDVKKCYKYILFITHIWQFSRIKIVYISTRDIKRKNLDG